MYTYIYIYIYTYIYIYIYILGYTRTCVYTYTLVCVHTYPFMYTLELVSEFSFGQFTEDFIRQACKKILLARLYLFVTVLNKCTCQKLFSSRHKAGTLLL